MIKTNYEHICIERLAWPDLGLVFIAIVLVISALAVGYVWGKNTERKRITVLIGYRQIRRALEQIQWRNRKP